MSSSRRDELLDAATRVLARRGYRGASIKDIAADAGVAAGLLHYYFPSKEQLILEILARIRARHRRDIEALVDTLAPDQLAARSFAASRQRVTEEPEWYRLRFEMFALGLLVPAFADEVAALLRDGRDGIAAVIRAIAGDPDLEVGGLAAVVLAAFDGLALQALVDPAFDVDGAYRALTAMVAAYRASVE
jgi:AcrR family transcriptional regulator